MSILDTQIIVNNILEFGCTVTVREVSDSFGSDEYRTLTETETNHADLKAWAQVLTLADDLVKEGIFQAGDLVFWFDTNNASYISTGNKIQHNSIWYEINDVIEHRIADAVYVIEARTKKI